MANLPLRGLGALGVMPDAKPYDLPANAFSDGCNVLFDEGGVQRGPVFKQLFRPLVSGVSLDSYGGTFDSAVTSIDSAVGNLDAGGNSLKDALGSPLVNSDDARFVGSYADPAAGETLIVCDSTGRIRGYPNGVVQDMTPTVIGSSDSPWTHAQIAGLSFLAREGMVPLVRRVAGSGTYQRMSDWDSKDTCAVVRGYNDFVVAFNITRDGEELPTLVKWSDPVFYNAEPSEVSWDPSRTTSNAGENTLGEMTSPIRDALSLGSVMVIYTVDQVWLMEYTGSSLLFSFRRLFASGGVINTNCVAEVDGRHMVFGDDDLYIHDGITKKSIADGRVRRTVFSELDRERRQSCFVQHDPVANLVYFAYPTSGSTGFCDRAAVYNYATDTWSFSDLPNAVGAGSINISVVGTDVVQGGLEVPRATVMLGVANPAAGLTASRVYAVCVPSYDTIPLEAHPETVKDSYVERQGIDLDEVAGLPLRSYKTLFSVVPLVDSEEPVQWAFGAADRGTAAPTWYTQRTFVPTQEYKMDMRVGGRFLAYRFSVAGASPFRLSGFDAEVKATSRR